MTTASPGQPPLLRLLRWGAMLALVVALAPWPLYWGINGATGVTGWDMQSVEQDMLELAQESEDLDEFLAMFGLSTQDSVGEQLAAVGRPGPFARNRPTSRQTRFILVPAERVHPSPWGPLVVFDRGHEELMQAQSLRNIAFLTSLAGAAALVLLGLPALLWSRLRRRRGGGSAER